MSPRSRPGAGALTARLRQALDTADCRSLADVLQPYVRWNPSDGDGTGCHTHSHVLSRCARLRALGLWAQTEETFAYPAAVVLGLRIHGTVPPADPRTVVYPVFDVVDGLVVRITGYTDRSQALDAAFPGATAAGPGH